jgi:L-rhamnose mutarotase
MTWRFGFKMKLYQGFKEEYLKRHNEIWPELVKLLKDEGNSTAMMEAHGRYYGDQSG